MIIRLMSRSRVVLLFFISMLYSSLSGQSVRLNGSGEGYRGAELRFFIQSDPVTKRMKPIFRKTCDDMGAFSCEVPVTGYATIFIKAGACTFMLFVNSGSDYQIGMPEYIPRPAGEDDNPFFLETRIIPEVISDTNDINNFIRLFDQEFNPLFNTVADRVALNYRVTEINAEIGRLNGIAAMRKDPFFSDFVLFRLMMLNNVASGTYLGRVEDSVLINRRFLPENPAYMDLIEQRYGGFLKKMATGPSVNAYFSAMSSGSLKEVRELVSAETGTVEPQLLDYIILMNLYSEFYESPGSQKAVTGILSAIRSEGSSEYIKGLASVLTDDLLSLLPGTKPPLFSLKGISGNRLSNDDFRGKFLLLSFSRSDNSSSLLEYGLLKMWNARYKDDLEVVTILRDRKFEEAVIRMKNFGFDWIFLDGSDSDILDYNYDIRMYPSFMLVGRDGNIISNTCPMPSENLESYIRNIIQRDKLDLRP